MKEKGFQNAEVTPEIKEIAGGPKLVHLTYRIDEGPKIKLNAIEFIGNQAITDAKLRKQMKNNKERIIWVRMFAGRSTYQEAKFDEDADKVIEYYRDQGYITVRVGQPELKVVSDSTKPAEGGSPLRPEATATRSGDWLRWQHGGEGDDLLCTRSIGAMLREAGDRQEETREVLRAAAASSGYGLRVP